MDFQKNKEGIAELQHCQITLKKIVLTLLFV
jgi:hypothetical protein